MINEERIIMMTRLALYEKKNGRKELKITKYFPGDYVALQNFWSFVCGTAAFLIMLAFWALYNIENIMMELFTMDIMLFARNILVSYIIFMAVYMLLCYGYHSYRYGKLKKNVNEYLRRIKALYKHYIQNGNQND